MKMRPLHQSQVMQTDSRRLIQCAKDFGHYPCWFHGRGKEYFAQIGLAARNLVTLEVAKCSQ